jgi:nucleotide-binding universal stress UspA family protein
MYQKILAPLDGSELSECSLELIRAIATGCHIPEVVLLRVVEPVPTVPQLSEDWRRNAEREALDSAQDYLSRLADNLKKEGVAAETIILKGRPAEEIVDYVKKNPVDLIIMSTHGRSGVSRWVFGSVAERVLRHSAVPVLLISAPGCRISAAS